MSRVPLPLAQLALSAINHLLNQQLQARERMQAHSGRSVRIVVNGPWGRSAHADGRIGADGRLMLLAGDSPPSAVLTMSPGVDAIFGALSAGAAGLGTHIKVEGDVMLAAALGKVAQSLRWDFEEDLSRIVGDGIAHRCGQALRVLQEDVQALRQRSREAFQRTAATGHGPLVSRDELAVVAGELEQLSERIGRLDGRVPAGSGVRRDPDRADS